MNLKLAPVLIDLSSILDVWKGIISIRDTKDTKSNNQTTKQEGTSRKPNVLSSKDQ